MAVKYPGSGIDVVQNEVFVLMSSMRKVYWSQRLYQEEENPLLKNLGELDNTLNQISDLKEIEPITFFGPFLDVIKSNEKLVPVTILALSAVDKFISYGLIEETSEKYLLPVIENIANTLANANFITTDILLEIVEVSRTLIVSPLGRLLSNDGICNLMLRCFRICFQKQLDEKLRRNAEHCLKRTVELLFRRLPDFIQTPVDKNSGHNKKMRIRSTSNEFNQKKKKSRTSQVTGSKRSVSVSKGSQDGSVGLPNKEQPVSCRQSVPNAGVQVSPECSTNDTQLVTGQAENSPLLNGSESQHQADGSADVSHNDLETNEHVLLEELQNDTTINANPSTGSCQRTVYPDGPAADDTNTNHDVSADKLATDTSVSSEESQSVNSSPVQSSSPTEDANNKQSYVNSQGVRFTSDDVSSEEYIPLEPHNSICVQELLRFLTVICNPHDEQNDEVMKRIGLSLLTIALEVGADAISRHPTLLPIVRDTLCRNLLALMNEEKMPIFIATLNVAFLLFKSMRYHLKFQLEYFLSRLSEIVVLDTSKMSYEKKEFALKCLVRLWKISGLSAELFINYDCDLYCSNLYEDITKLLSKNAYPVAEIYRTHLLSLDALLTIVDSIEKHCHSHVSSDATRHEQTEDPTAPAIEKQESNYTILSHEQLMAVKRKKKLLSTGTENFNTNPKKGVQFLQEQGLLSTPLEPFEVATFLRENPHLDKKHIGEYISHRSNLHILEQFVNLFDFTDMRIDEALRLYLEAFRLSGESPLIAEVMQKFADRWHSSNNKPFSNSDAAFVLAYAIIMLNVDQHNQVARRQHTPMTVEAFKKNLKGMDDGKDFDEELLEAIYHSIKNDEIVMPAERTGLLRENYLWKVLLRRGSTKDGVYIRAADGAYDHELFSISWGPVVTALSYIFDKSTESAISDKVVQGFSKCATISAHYGMSAEFDKMTLSLCKFTMLLNPVENPESFTVSFGMNAKARLAAETVFNLVHQHGDTLREGWRPIFDCIFQLFRCKLLPKILVEAEDFLELSGKISLVREDVSNQKTTETGLLSSLYSYITLVTDVPSQQEQDYMELAKIFIGDCHLERLILESKFLRLESLRELLKVLIRECYNADNVIVVNTKQEEDRAVFFLELLLKVVIQNRDRINSVWPIVHKHLHTLLTVAATAEQQFLIERCVIGLLRLAIRLTRRDEVSSAVLQSLQILMLLKWSTLHLVSRQISYGLYELVKTGAANIHSEADWAVIFTLFEVVGAGAPLPKLARTNEDAVVCSDGKSSEGVAPEDASEDGGLDSEKQFSSGSDLGANQSALSTSPSSCNSYLSVNDGDEGRGPFYTCNDLLPHDPFSLVKCCESLAFLVRDVAHITPFNFRNCVHTMRTFVEATLYPGEIRTKKKAVSPAVGKSRAKTKTTWKKGGGGPKNQSGVYDADESDPDDYPDSYFQVPLQLLDLMHTLHTKTAHIHHGWTKENEPASSLWPHGWCPLLQGIARLCCDPRKSIRTSAVTYLQRALLMHDLEKLEASEWESCFNSVLFPLLEDLKKPFQGKDSVGVEETRMRAATLLSKVFLHHLSTLSKLDSFNGLWRRILTFMRDYSQDESSDLLNEAIQESVKNMILVLKSAKLFSDDDSTWEIIGKFMPGLRNELNRYHSTVSKASDQYMPAMNSPESPTNEFRDPRATKPRISPDEPVEPKHSNIASVKHSVPIFPHMGQLISTPIGPPSFSYPTDRYQEDADSAENVNSDTQMSSLIASAPDFLASLPSFRTTSPPTVCSPRALSPPAFQPPPGGAICSQYSPPPSVSPERAYSPVSYPCAIPPADAARPINSAATLPFLVQRSSSLCEASAASVWQSNMMPERTESFPALLRPNHSPLSEPPRVTTASSPVSLDTLGAVECANPAPESTAVSSVAETANLGGEQSFVPAASTAGPHSSIKLSFPVYSGFAQLSSDAIGNMEESNEKQFFYQNWYVK